MRYQQVEGANSGPQSCGLVAVAVAGAELYETNADDREAGYFVKWMGANSEPRKGFAKFTLSREEISAEFVGSTSTSDFTDRFRIGER